LANTGVREAVKDADCVYQCTNPAYHRWPQEFPTLQENILAAAADVNARLIIAENVYMYGDSHGLPLTEEMPHNATTRKGKIRSQMSLDALRAHQEGRVKVVIGRGSDFFGPRVLNSMLGERQIGFAVQGKRSSLIGNIDVPHTLTYIKDFGKALVTLSQHEESYGSVWHVPNAPAMTQREIILQVFSELQRTPSYNTMGKMMLRIGGLFIPAARESVEMMYEFEQPFFVDSSKFERTFAVSATPLSESLNETVQWFQQFYAH
jgi:nucleoside-diphosphate-sugar epimerase